VYSGYGRVVFAILAIYYNDQVVLATVCYATSQLLDAVDGPVARALGKSSSFGALLDMLTDRMSSMCLMLLLGDYYPEWKWGWNSMVVLDIVSHWVQMYSKVKKGSSHKVNTNPILAFYYGFPTLFIFCFGNEGFFISSYVLKHAKGPEVPFLGATNYWRQGNYWTVWEFLWTLALPFFICKQFFNIVQLADACNDIAETDYPTTPEAKAAAKAAAAASAKKAT
jgi:CDP-diacylglycerol--inositol 3-phosphatidyltransferase